MDEQVVKPLGDLLRKVQSGNETVFDVVKDTLPDGTPKTVLSVINRRVNPEQPLPPVKAPSPRREHSFHGIEGFIAYLKKFGGENTVVLADIENEFVSAVLNERAETGFEIVRFRPQMHPLFEPWDHVIGQWMKLRSFVDFLSQNRRAVKEPEGKYLVRLLSQIKVSRNVELCQGFGNQSINGVMVELNIAGGTGKQELVELPEEIIIEAPLYGSVAAVEISCDITLDATESEGVVIKITSSDLLQKRIDIFQGFVDQVSTEMSELCTVGLGRPQHGDWQVLRA